jgi:small subunit ribosomal protein S2
MSTIIDEKALFESNLHVGHRTSTWNPKMKPYIYSTVNGVHVFDLSQTKELLGKVKQFLTAVKIQNGKVLFVGTKPQTSIIIRKHLAESKHLYIDQKWQPGLLTNFTEIKKRIDYYKNLKSMFATGEINKYTKKEVAKKKKELDKLDKMYSGVQEMREKPKLVVVLDSVCDRLAVDEARSAGVAVVAVTDSNANPDGIDYIIPANDDSLEGIEFLLQYFLGVLN